MEVIGTQGCVTRQHVKIHEQNEVETLKRKDESSGTQSCVGLGESSDVYHSPDSAG